jgi:hypothetical protein
LTVSTMSRERGREILVHRPDHAARHGIGQQLGHAHGALEHEQRIVGAGAVAPEAEAAVRADQRSDLRGVEHPGIAGHVLDVPVDVLREADHARDGDVRQGLVRAGLLVDQRAQAHGAGGGIAGHIRIGGGVPGEEVGHQQHQLALAEIGAIGGCFGDRRAQRAGIDKAAQLLGDHRERGGDSLRLKAGRAQDLGLDAQLRLRGEQGLHAGLRALGRGRADHVAGGGGVISSFGHAHHDQDRAGLVGNRAQRAGSVPASPALPMAVSISVTRTGRSSGNGIGIGVGRGGDKAEDRGGNSGQRPGAGADLGQGDTMFEGHERVP